jgi:uncharacterized membrane protein
MADHHQQQAAVAIKTEQQMENGKEKSTEEEELGFTNLGRKHGSLRLQLRGFPDAWTENLTHAEIEVFLMYFYFIFKQDLFKIKKT